MSLCDATFYNHFSFKSASTFIAADSSVADVSLLVLVTRVAK